MPSTNLNVRIDTEVKRAAEKVFADLGLNLSSAINIFLRQAIRVNGIPFDLHNGEQSEKVSVSAAKASEPAAVAVAKETEPVIEIIPASSNHQNDQGKSDKSDILSEFFDFRTE